MPDVQVTPRNKTTSHRVAIAAFTVVATLIGGCVADPVAPHSGYLGGGADGGGGGSDTPGTDTPGVDAGNVGCVTDAECVLALSKAPECMVAVCGTGKVCAFTPAPKNTKCGAADTPCVESTCSKGDGTCVAKNLDSGPCDDGDGCTLVDSCKAGKCVGSQYGCLCKPDDVSKCYGKTTPETEEGNKCLGEPFCEAYVDGGQNKYRCAVNETTIVKCGTTKDEQCRKNVCVPATGKCELQSEKNGKTCEDGIKCTLSDACVEGQCKPGTDACWCTPTKGTGNCDGGAPGQIDMDPTNKCEGDVFCEASYDATAKLIDYKCQRNLATVVNCSTTQNTACLKNTCDSKTGKCGLEKTKAGLGLCDDGNPCTANDVCTDGKCVGGVSVCGCTSSADCVEKEDGNLCNGSLFCDLKVGKCVLNPKTVVTCSDVNDTACLSNICFPTKGKCELTPRENISVNDVLEQEVLSPGVIKVNVIGTKVVPYDYPVRTVYCSDGNPCTANDSCTKGKCLSTQAPICLCTTDNDCAKKEDGDVCNGTLFCDTVAGACKLNPASIVTCATSGDNDCAKTSCDPKSGKCSTAAVADDQPCEDGDLCTASDKCLGGKCQPGTTICECKVNADCASQEDGNLCNGTMYCDKTQKDETGKEAPKCVTNPASLVYCSPALDTECRKNTCTPKTGKCSLQSANEYKSCDAGNPCYASPVCSGGVCSWETNLCACTADKDCAYILGPAGNQNLCLGKAYCDTVNGVCKLSTASVPLCVAAKSDACNDWKCNPTSGACEFFAKSSFTPCNDGQACTVSDSCGLLGGAPTAKEKKGVCLSGTDICQCVADADCAPYDDGDKCTGSLYCDKGTCKATGKPPACVNAGGADVCVISQCNSSDGQCVDVTDPVKCDDANPCTNDTCENKVCKHVAVAPGFSCLDPKTGSGVCADDKTKVSICQPPPLPNLKFVPASKVAIGCNAATGVCKDTTETPLHTILISPFWMQRFEVTVKEFSDCVKAGKCTAPDKATYTTTTPVNIGNDCNYQYKDASRDNHPINCVDWDQAKAFCAYFHSDARLPTEAEWEKAARGGCELYTSCEKQAYTYVWGDKPQPDCNRAIHNSSIQGAGCGEGSTVAVGTLLKGDESLYGINDLAGNVSEWVSDYYLGAWYSTGPASKDDPTGPTSGTERMMRGGAWTSKVDATNQMRISWRGHDGQTKRSASVGFRCVIPLK